MITIWQRCSSWFHFWTDQTVLTLPFTHLVITSITGDYRYRYLVKNNLIWLLIPAFKSDKCLLSVFEDISKHQGIYVLCWCNLKYCDFILRTYPSALSGAYVIIIPATLFGWKMSLKWSWLIGPVMSGSDWLSVFLLFISSLWKWFQKYRTPLSM